MNFAVVFPGQGSQSIGMLKDFAAQSIVRETFAAASDALSLDLWALCQEGAAEEINSTINTQPVLLTAGVALWQLWLARTDAKPTLLAGHSLGEYTALVCGKAITLTAAVKLVRQRGKYMQMAVTDGAMAAILGLTNEEVAELCGRGIQTGYVQTANINAPHQIVIAGYAKAVEDVSEEALKRGAEKSREIADQRSFSLRAYAIGGRPIGGRSKRH